MLRRPRNNTEDIPHVIKLNLIMIIHNVYYVSSNIYSFVNSEGVFRDQVQF